MGSPASDKSQECNFPYSQAVPVMQVQCGSWWVSWDPAAPGDLGSSQGALRRPAPATERDLHRIQAPHVSTRTRLGLQNFSQRKLL